MFFFAKDKPQLLKRSCRLWLLKKLHGNISGCQSLLCSWFLAIPVGSRNHDTSPRRKSPGTMGQEINTAKAINCFACHHNKTPIFHFSHVSTSGFYFDIGLWCRNKGHRQIQALAHCLGFRDRPRENHQRSDLLTKQHLYTYMCNYIVFTYGVYMRVCINIVHVHKGVIISYSS